MVDKIAARRFVCSVALGLLACGAFGLVVTLDNGLALTPPMGWLAWERYVCETDCSLYPSECINSRLFEEMADRLVEDGFRQLGYEYVNIDDCWSTRKRDNASKALQPDPLRFASMPQLADYMHSRGLKLGIYGDCGTETCQGFPGQLNNSNSLEGNYFQLDANTFAAWSVDSFKFDGCYLNVSQAAKICPLMENALNQTGRPILFSCSWPAYENDENMTTNWDLVVEKCNLWRAFGDIEDSWKSVIETIDWFVKKQDLVIRYHGPGHWFDADQLVVGDFGLSLGQEQAQMAIWSVWASPLYMSNDLRSIGKESSKILRNKWVIAVNQDKMGIFGLMVHEYKYLQVFIKPVEPIARSCPSYAVVYFDRRTIGNSRFASFKLSTLLGRLHEKLSIIPKWSHWSHCSNSSRKFSVHDLFHGFDRLGKDLDLSTDSLELRVSPSGVRMVKLIEEQLDLQT